MSIKWMNQIWMDSTQEGQALLLLLAIADNADDDGVAWPGAKYLAKKIRTKRKANGERSVRNVYRLVKHAEESGELYVHRKQGEVNRYLICIERTSQELATVMMRRFKLQQDYALEVAETIVVLPNRTRDNLSLVTGESLGSDTAVSPDPSLSITYNTAERNSVEWKELQLMTCRVCKKIDILAMSDKDRDSVDTLYILKVKPAELLEFYDRGKWWYKHHWKGLRGQFPTIQDILDSLEQARTADVAQIDDAQDAWAEVNQWIKGNKAADTFTSPYTVLAVRKVGEFKLKSLGRNNWKAISTAFIEAFMEEVNKSTATEKV